MVQQLKEEGLGNGSGAIGVTLRWDYWEHKDEWDAILSGGIKLNIL